MPWQTVAQLIIGVITIAVSVYMSQELISQREKKNRLTGLFSELYLYVVECTDLLEKVGSALGSNSEVNDLHLERVMQLHNLISRDIFRVEIELNERAANLVEMLADLCAEALAVQYPENYESDGFTDYVPPELEQPIQDEMRRLCLTTHTFESYS